MSAPRRHNRPTIQVDNSRLRLQRSPAMKAPLQPAMRLQRSPAMKAPLQPAMRLHHPSYRAISPPLPACPSREQMWATGLLTLLTAGLLGMVLAILYLLVATPLPPL